MQHFLTPDEHAVYPLLRQVAENHLRTQALSLNDLLTVAVSLVGRATVPLVVAGSPAQTVMDDVVRLTITLARTGTSAPFTLVAIGEDPMQLHSNVATLVLEALGTMLDELVQARGLSQESARRLAVCILVDSIMTVRRMYGIGQVGLAKFVRQTVRHGLETYLRLHVPRNVPSP